MGDEKTIYRERTQWPGWVNAIFWTAIIGVSYPVLAGWDTDMDFAARVMTVGSVVGVAVAVKLVLGGLTVLVQETRVFIHLGSAPLLHRKVPYADIEGLAPVQYRPIREFGGWGIRGWGKRKAWTARGDRAVVLTLVGDRELYIGSDRPQRLEDRIRTAAGDQFAA
jgi:hypothetical protein